MTSAARLFHTLTESAARWNRARSLNRQLMDMSDCMLEDIGLLRMDVVDLSKRS